MNYISPTHQAAGHEGYFTPEDGSLFIKATDQQEIDFYTQVQAHDDEQDDEQDDSYLGSKLSDWMPLYMGTLTSGDITKSNTSATTNNNNNNNNNNKKYIVLQNLYQGFKRPSILDIKLGALLTDPDSTSPDKIARLKEVSQSSTSGSLHFRICGMDVYNGNNTKLPTDIFPNMNKDALEIKKDNEYIFFNKLYGRSLTTDTINEGILLYFKHNFAEQQLGSRIIRRLLSTFLKRLQLLYNCILDYEIRIYSGSLLFIYESDLSMYGEGILDDDEKYDELDPLVQEPIIEVDDDDDEDEDEYEDGEDTQQSSQQFTPLSSLHFIDFAHAKFVKGKGHDDNIIIGIENLINIFEQLVQDYK
ncbi:uncharacterized protein RJT21DRAFT_13204 [Scheffersomyces amazonensis]|uniref:uncharacterized protein n=1 Tax=Scheffersomyces amazonensis TaxID=1078765 RepID=UPI00315C6753